MSGDFFLGTRFESVNKKLCRMNVDNRYERHEELSMGLTKSLLHSHPIGTLAAAFNALKIAKYEALERNGCSPEFIAGMGLN